MASKGTLAKAAISASNDDDEMGDMEMAAQELINAIRSKDPAAVADALRAAIACHQTEMDSEEE